MVRLHLNCQKDLFCHHLCLQRTSLEDKVKYWMFAKSEVSTVIQSKVMRAEHLKAFRTLKIGLTGMGTEIIQLTVKTIAHRTLNLIWRNTITSSNRNASSSGMWSPHQVFPDWFGLHRSQRHRLKWCWWWSKLSKQGGIGEWNKSMPECVNYSPASLCILTESSS